MANRDTESVYREMSPGSIPWNLEEPPQALVGLVGSGVVKPCKAADLGCGTGNYSIYLASLGFEMTGFDMAPTAIELAKKNALEKKAACRFLLADLTKELAGHDREFDFIFDWDVLHHVYPRYRRTYVENAWRMLKPGGLYLSVCFHTSDPAFGGTGKYRTTSIGTRLYFSSTEEMARLFSRKFSILEKKLIHTRGKGPGHAANCFLMRK